MTIKKPTEPTKKFRKGFKAKFVQFRYSLIPPRIIDYYNLDNLVANGFVYAHINWAWYGLKQG